MSANTGMRNQMYCNCPALSGLKCDVADYVTAIPAVRVVRQRPRGINGGYTYG